MITNRDVKPSAVAMLEGLCGWELPDWVHVEAWKHDYFPLPCFSTRWFKNSGCRSGAHIGKTCNFCFEPATCTHHVDGCHSNNSLDNIAYACDRCHHEHHNGDRRHIPSVIELMIKFGLEWEMPARRKPVLTWY